MPPRTRTAAAATAVAFLALTGCGPSSDEVFSNLNGTSPSSSPDTATPDAQRDAPPNYADDNRARRAGEMSPQDEKRARQKAAEVHRALDELRRSGRISPDEVRPVLAQLAGPAHLSVQGRQVGTGMEHAEGSAYGIWIAETACVTGAVSEDRVWADVNGHYPETGCLPPAVAH
ncbi:hypothetical protein AB0M39_21915 [Streptomyces sp. NPDC051907]|uniref:hypothetical protein n=1 Tax=Streptomyces sp. NPDC051907 TaxID=3155284 RepID=UPI0034347A34